MTKAQAKRGTETRRGREAGSGDAKPRPKANANVMGAAADVMGRTLTGFEDVGREVGATAIAAMRGSMHAAEQLGGDLLSVARAAVEGTIEAAERIGTATNRAVKHIVSGDNGARRKATPSAAPKRSRRRGRPPKASETTGAGEP